MSEKKYTGRPWSYSIIAAIVIFMIGTLIMVFIMVKQDIYVLYPDYYERTLDYDSQYDKLTLGKKVEYQVKYQFSTQRDSLFFNFPSRDFAEGKLIFTKPDDANLDKTLTFKVSENQSFAVIVSEWKKGKWNLEIEWVSDTTEIISRMDLVL